MNYARKLICFLTAFAVMVVGTNAFALDLPAKPDNGWYVRDVANKISPSNIMTLNRKIENFNKTTRNEIGALIMPPIGDASLEDFAHDVFHKWGIGKAGLDNGILILVVSGAPGHKLMRIETGKGAEGDIPDGKVKEITGSMKPFLRTDDYYGAVNVAIDTIMTLMESRAGVKPIVRSTTPGALLQDNVAPTPTYSPTTSTPTSTTQYDPSNDFSGVWLLFGVCGVIFSGLIFAIWLSGRDEKKKFIRVRDALTYDPPVKGVVLPPTPSPFSNPYFPPPPPVVRHVAPRTTNQSPYAAAPVVRKTHKKHKHVQERSTSSSGGYVSSSNDDSWSSPSSSSSDSGFSAPDSGSGFGGGDSGGGGGSDSC